MKNATIGLRIKKMREDAELRQNQIAAYLDVDQSYLSKIESGERNISVDLLEKLLEFYGCSMETFMNEDFAHNSVRIALRAKDVTVEDMNIIATINHIAENSRYMARLLKECE